jgi:hypothetical protein
MAGMSRAVTPAVAAATPVDGAAPGDRAVGLSVEAGGVGPPDPALMGRQYRWYGGIAGVAIAAGWHVGNDLRGVIAGWSDYRWPALALACWLGYTVLGVAAGVALLRGRRHRSPWAGAASAVALSVGVQLACRTDALVAPANWGWGSVGWLALLVLWDRRLAALVGFLAVNAGATFVGLVARGVTDRRSMAVFLMVIVGSVTLQLGFGAGARLLTATGHWVTARSEDRTSAAVERVRAEAAHRARERLGRAVHGDTLPLLRALAAGADPAEAAVRHRAAVGAARLRRLLLQARGEAEPLTVELRSCADIAARTGAVVDLEVHGRVPALDEPVRLALTEPALNALAGTRRHARVTVTAAEGEVVVAVITDAVDVDLSSVGGVRGVTVEHYATGEGEGLWIESRWTRG